MNICVLAPLNKHFTVADASLLGNAERYTVRILHSETHNDDFSYDVASVPKTYRFVNFIGKCLFPLVMLSVIRCCRRKEWPVAVVSSAYSLHRVSRISRRRVRCVPI